MQILLAAATPFEIAPVLNWLGANFTPTKAGFFEKAGLAVFPLVTGVGMTATAFHLGQFYARQRPDLALNAGIAGVVGQTFQLGEVLNVVSERFGDLGAEEADGRFSDLFELNLCSENTFPFVNGRLDNPAAGQAAFLPQGHGITVNKVHGSPASIAAMEAKYPTVQVESMEGAAFFYASLAAGVPFLEIRSISNRVEPRNRGAWNLPLAIQNLNQTLVEIFNTFLS